MTAEVRKGATFGRLTVISELKKKNNKGYVEVRCDCGVVKELPMWKVRSSVSCGAHKATHGMSGSKTYLIWKAMLDRTSNPNNPVYTSYKDRSPPEEWNKFENFFKDMGVCPEDHSLERLDNRLPYSKDNCEWIPRGLQASNRSNTGWVKLKDGNKMCLKKLTEILNLKYTTVYRRITIGKKNLTQVLGVDAEWCDAPTREEIRNKA